MTHHTLVLLLKRGAAPECVHTVHRHGQTEALLPALHGLPRLQTELLQQRPHHITAGPHTSHPLGGGAEEGVGDRQLYIYIYTIYIV